MSSAPSVDPLAGRERLGGRLERRHQLGGREQRLDPLDRRHAFVTLVATDPRHQLRRDGRRHGDAVSLDLRGQVRLCRPGEEHAAVFRRDAGAGHLAIPRAPADPIPRLEDHHARARFLQVPRGGDPREPRSQHDDVGVHEAGSYHPR